jgi:hypothetical protein
MFSLRQELVNGPIQWLCCGMARSSKSLKTASTIPIEIKWPAVYDTSIPGKVKHDLLRLDCPFGRGVSSLIQVKHNLFGYRIKNIHSLISVTLLSLKWFFSLSFSKISRSISPRPQEETLERRSCSEYHIKARIHRSRQITLSARNTTPF